MSGWELATLASILVLLGGSLAVFAWFLVDVRRVLGPRPGAEDPHEPEDRKESHPAP